MAHKVVVTNDEAVMDEDDVKILSLSMSGTTFDVRKVPADSVEL